MWGIKVTEKFAEEANEAKRRKSKNIEKQRNLSGERVGEQKATEKKAKKRILWNTQLRNSKCLTFVFYFYQLEAATREENENKFSYDSVRWLWRVCQQRNCELDLLPTLSAMHFRAWCRESLAVALLPWSFYRRGSHLRAVEHSSFAFV